MNRRSPFSQVSVFALLAAAAGLSTGVGVASAQDVEVIYSKVSTLPNSLVPGALDLAGQPAETRFRALEDIILSPDGSRWMLKGRTQQGGDLENIMFLGSGNSGTMWLQEGQPVPAGQPGELIEFFGSGLGRFDDMNRFALSLRARGGTSSIFQKIVTWDGVNFAIPFTMGTPLQELIDDPNNITGDELFGNSVGSIHLLNDGRIGSHDLSIQNCHSTRRPALFYDTTSFHQINVTNVVGLNGVGIETWLALDGNAFYTTPDGAHWHATGRVVGQASSDAVFVYDGQVRFQTGAPVEVGSSVTFADVFQTYLSSNGNWYSRGDDPADTDWATVNGQIVAKTGDPIVPGSTENWGNTFLAFSGNNNGDWVLVGNTDNPDNTRDTVVVLNGQQVIMREGDALDLNGNGMLDDDAYLGRGNPALGAFEPNDAVLTDDLTLYIIATIHNEAGMDLNSDPAFGSPQVFLRVALGGGDCPADWNGDTEVNSGDISAFLTAWLDSVNNMNLIADFNNDMVVNSGDISAFLTAWLDAVHNGC